MKNLGKLLLLTFLLQQTLFANIRASVDSPSVELGDTVTYTLSVSGSDIQKPNIDTLCDSDIISTGSQTSIEVINGSYQKSYRLSYSFLPEKSCVIEPIELMIDGKVEKSNSVKVDVNTVVASKDSEYKLILQSDKKEVYVGESFNMTLTFKQRKGARGVDSKFIPPKMKGFWVKNETKPIQYEEGNYIVTKITYTIAGQREGQLQITKAQMRVATRSRSNDRWNSFLSGVKWKTYFSNELNIDIKPLPQGVSLVGDFQITVDIDKTTLNSNEAVNVEIKVSGVGNLEDIKSFKPNIAGVSVFDEKIAINNTVLTQKIALVGEKDFTIPPFSIKYFDTKTKTIKTIATKKIDVKVTAIKKQTDLVIKKEQTHHITQNTDSTHSEGISKTYFLITSILGFIVGVVFMLIKPWNLFQKGKTRFSTKNHKQLLIKLLPYKENKDVAELIALLEDSSYYSKDTKIDKKMVKKIISKYEIT